MADSADPDPATPRAARPLATHARASTREVAGADALLLRGAATRRRDLEAMMSFAARRRLARVAAPDGAGSAQPAEMVPGAGAAQAGSAAPMPAGRTDAPRLLKRIDVTQDLLRLKVSRPPGFEFRPGQHVKMGVPGLLRTYSLVSAPHEPHLEFFVELFPGGRLSERLRRLVPGTAMALGDRAKGKLLVDERFPNHLLIATVTGIAPYVSFVRHQLRHNGGGGTGGRRFVILHGASHADELGYADELAELARRHPQTLSYVPTVSRPESPRNAGWTGHRGRVETHVEALLTRLGFAPRDTAVFACGHPEMVGNMAQAFRRRGFAIHTEAFD